MLIEFRVANHRSLRDEQVLTMEAGRVGDEADPRPRHVPGHAEPLLTVAGLYGANASGKSNVLAALAFMREAVLESHLSWSPAPDVPRDPFAWGPKRKEPSLLEVVFLLDHVRYEYGFRVSDEQVLEEWLYAWPNGRRQVWFEHDGDTYKFRGTAKGRKQGHPEYHSSECVVPFGCRAIQSPAAFGDLLLVSVMSTTKFVKRPLSHTSHSHTTADAAQPPARSPSGVGATPAPGTIDSKRGIGETTARTFPRLVKEGGSHDCGIACRERRFERQAAAFWSEIRTEPSEQTR